MTADSHLRPIWTASNQAGDLPVNAAGMSHGREISAQAEQNACQERHLWLVVLSVLMIVASGLVVALLPRAFSEPPDSGPLPTLLLGFLTLITLLNIYAGRQRRSLLQTRKQLMGESLRAERALAQSFVDPVTQLFNRRYMDHILQLESKRSERSGNTFTIVMVDIDGFKAINDRFGHAEGDNALRQVAGLLKQVFRQTDTIIRYGGDEFLVLMPDTTATSAERALARLAEHEDWCDKTDDPSGYRVRLSWGMACSGAGDHMDDILVTADRQMYAAKQAKAQGGRQSTG